MSSAPGEGPRHGGRGSLAITLGVAALVIALDQVTKQWALGRLSDGRNIDLIGSLRFHLTFNTGMAFSGGRGFGPVIGVVALGVVVALLVSLRRGSGRLGAVAVGLVVGGALGNIADRLFRSDDGFLQGGVVDFIDLQWWPVFNVADIAVTVGGVLLVASMLWRDHRARPEASPDEADSWT